MPAGPADTAARTDRVKGCRSTGRRVGRVHVLTRPLTDHLRFEFAHYRHNIAAGEDIRILDPPFLEFLEERG
ncbi:MULTISPECIES: DUF6879 family protein [unclassified Kitasatospora]|uniref:DUF6879 family protein n=1 Tax=unclassified Kitasatospora TaxID=2633591 RepID=UPI00380ADC14